MGMYLPQLGEPGAAKALISAFGGYNHNLSAGEHEFYDMRNLTSDGYPLLTPRGRRGRVRRLNKPNGLFAHEKLCWVDGTDFYYGGQVVGQVEDSAKQFAGMGAYVLIWPDKAYYNSGTGEFGSLEARTETTGVTAALCDRAGEPYANYSPGGTSPANPTDGQLWLDTASAPNVLKRYSNYNGAWISIPTTYVKLTGAGLGAGFAEGDGVTIAGMPADNLNGEFLLFGAGADYVIVTAIIPSPVTAAGAVTVERKAPCLDYVTESDNRLWGCSSAAHEIYACKLGDPRNWHSFAGISTDSYTMTVGSPGDFTGCCTHLGYVMFFKQDVIHKIYGNKPSNYQLTNTVCEGVEQGSASSLAIVGGALHYKAQSGVCAFNASLPEVISQALGHERYTGAAAGARGGKYYVSMEDERGEAALFVYDTQKGLWHMEDCARVRWFAAHEGELYFIADNCVWSVGGTLPEAYRDADAALEGRVRWWGELGLTGLDSPDSKYVSKLQLRLEAGDGTLIRILFQYNGGEWEEVYKVNMTHRRSFTLPLIPRRCDTLRVRIEGEGDCRVYSITKTLSQGSDV